MDLASFAIDGGAPGRVERASSTADVARILAGAHAAREAVVVWGGGTRIGIGDAPARYDVALDLRGLGGVVEHAPADLVCTVRAGATLAELADAFAASRQAWPVEVADPRTATVGGTIASAAAGPSRLRYQHPRDWIIGCEAVLADGTVTRAGGRVVKNVTGYDLTRLYSGTFGTLAVLTEITLKLVAAPETVRAFRAEGRRDEIARLAEHVHAARLPLDALVCEGSDDAASLIARAAGSASATARVGTMLRQLGPFEDADPSQITQIHERTVRDATVLRLSLPPGRELEVARRAASATVHVGSGTAFAYGPTDVRAVADLRHHAESAGGALVLERADTAVRAAAGTWGARRIPAAVAARLKERFDPRGILAPGRM